MKLTATRVGVITLLAGFVRTSDINGRAAAHSFDKANTAELKMFIAAVNDNGSNRSNSDCTKILTCGAKIQGRLNGEYTKAVGICNGRPTYTQTGTSEGTIYLYYWVGLGGLLSSWDFGSQFCGDSLYATAWDNAPTPDLITEPWWEFNYNSGNMDENRDMSTRCVSPGYYECSSGPSIHVTSLGLLIGALLFSIKWSSTLKPGN